MRIRLAAQATFRCGKQIIPFIAVRIKQVKTGKPEEE